MDSRNIQEFLGVDVGGARVGIARGNTAARIAQPLKTIDAQGVIEELSELVQLHSATGIVVGLPRSLDGSETAQTATVRHWAKSASQKIKLPFYWQDEALTSQQAQNLEPQSNSPGLDAQAAALILQDFLDTPEGDRVTV